MLPAVGFAVVVVEVVVLEAVMGVIISTSELFLLVRSTGVLVLICVLGVPRVPEEM